MSAKHGQALLTAFLDGKVDGRDFRHHDHLRVGFELLRRHNFPDSLAAYSAALKGIAARAGNPGAYHETITVVFLSLIAEHNARVPYTDFEAFVCGNPELMDKSILDRWYAPERLRSEIARQTFVMPEGDRLRRDVEGEGIVAPGTDIQSE
jgi:hypothetical protein